MSNDIKLSKIERVYMSVGDHNIRTYHVSYTKEDSVCCKTLYPRADVAHALGYVCANSFNPERIILNGDAYSDAKAILEKIKSTRLKGVKKNYTKDILNILTYENEAINLNETKKLLEQNNITNIDRYIDKTESMQNIKKTESIKTDEMLDFSKELTNLGNTANECAKITSEISELKKKIADLESEIEIKEKQSKQIRESLSECGNKLIQNKLSAIFENPEISSVFEKLFENPERSKKITELTEHVKELKKENQSLNDKVSALEEENQLLNDKLGEGENFKTADMFPDKKKYFAHDNKDTNGCIGLALSKMASAMNIEIHKIPKGGMMVGNYPVHLMNILTEWICNSHLNEYTKPLQPLLKQEYKAVF